MGLFLTRNTNTHNIITIRQKNRDGYVTRNDFPGPDHRFNHMDQNNDGVLTRGELP